MVKYLSGRAVGSEGSVSCFLNFIAVLLGRYCCGMAYTAMDANVAQRKYPGLPFVANALRIVIWDPSLVEVTAGVLYTSEVGLGSWVLLLEGYRENGQSTYGLGMSNYMYSTKRYCSFYID